NCESALGPKPCRRHLHRRRINPGQKESGQETEKKRGPKSWCGENTRVRECAEKGGSAENPASGDDVCEIQNRGNRRPADEPQLNDRCQPAGFGGGEAPDRAKLRSYCAGRKPERHPQ